jgi:drug/metabolite transporter (DMT)-like permease
VPPRDRLLALLVAVCLGVNFPATTPALQHFPPLLMVALRFTLIAIPTMIFVPTVALAPARGAAQRPGRAADHSDLGRLPSILGLLYIVIIATLIGYGLWNTLLAVTPTSTPLVRRRRTAAGMPVAQARSLVGSARAARRRS